MLKFKITKEEKGYLAVAKTGDSFISAQGENWEDLEKNIKEVVDLYLENRDEEKNNFIDLSVVTDYRLDSYA